MIDLLKSPRLFATASLLFAAPALAYSLTISDVWINEFHYDNDGGDANEFIEVVGKAGADLTNLQLITYNGANGEVDDIFQLSGTLGDAGSGFGFAHTATPGIQNGPDGIALVFGSTVLQFLSYEGAFEATEGLANGLTSSDVGVDQPASTDVGTTLQLIGTGSTYGSFDWALQENDSPGAINEGQSFVRPISREPTSAVPSSGSSALLLVAGLSLMAHVKRKAG